MEIYIILLFIFKIIFLSFFWRGENKVFWKRRIVNSFFVCVFKCIYFIFFWRRIFSFVCFKSIVFCNVIRKGYMFCIRVFYNFYFVIFNVIRFLCSWYIYCIIFWLRIIFFNKWKFLCLVNNVVCWIFIFYIEFIIRIGVWSCIVIWIFWK